MNVRKAVIPVAGFGTRFLPATKATPKEMFPVVDKPLAQYVVEEAVAAGIEEIIFVTGQAKRAIEDHFDRNFELEYLLESKGKHEQLKVIRDISEMVQFAYVRQKEMRGLGHAILQARNLVGDEPFAVILPDNLFCGKTPAIADLITAYQEVQAPVCAVKEVPEDQVHHYGIIAGEEVKPGLWRMTDTIEKPSVKEAPSRQAAIGRYILFPEIFETIEQLPEGKGGEIQLNDAIREIARMRPVYAATVSAEFHDAGDKLGYLKAITEFALSRDDLKVEYERYLREKLK
jgi:UTP--glucose-1-phosphate uridylyltransferase